MSEIKTVAQAIKSDSPSLGTVLKSEGEAPTVAMLVKILDPMIKYFSVGKGMGSEQIIETAKLMLQEFPRLKIADLKVFGDLFKSGHYGVVYDRMDGNVILVNLRKYYEDRIEVAEMGVLTQHKDLMDAENKEDARELYFIKAGDWYLVEVDEEYQTTKESLAASKYTFEQAVRIKRQMERIEIPGIKIERVNKPKKGLIEYFKEHNPKTAKEVWKKHPTISESSKTYQTKCREILKDEALSELEKVNKIRGLTGLAALSEAEFELSKSVLK